VAGNGKVMRRFLRCVSPCLAVKEESHGARSLEELTRGGNSGALSHTDTRPPRLTATAECRSCRRCRTVGLAAGPQLRLAVALPAPSGEPGIGVRRGTANGFRSRDSKWVLQAINLPNVPLSVAAAAPMQEDRRMAETTERGTAAVEEARQEGEGEPCQIGDGWN
jgi:hypothetical protein